MTILIAPPNLRSLGTTRALRAVAIPITAVTATAIAAGTLIYGAGPALTTLVNDTIANIAGIEAAVSSGTVTGGAAALLTFTAIGTILIANHNE